MKTKFRKEAKNDFEKDFFNPNFGILPPPPPPPCWFSLNNLEIVKPVTLAIYSIQQHFIRDIRANLGIPYLSQPPDMSKLRRGYFQFPDF